MLTGSCGSPFPFTWTSALLLLSSSHGSNMLKKPVNCPGKAPLSRFACVCLHGGWQLSLFPQSHKLEVTLRAQSASGSLSCPEYFILGAGALYGPHQELYGLTAPNLSFLYWPGEKNTSTQWAARLPRVQVLQGRLWALSRAARPGGRDSPPPRHLGPQLSQDAQCMMTFVFVTPSCPLGRVSPAPKEQAKRQGG